jgi:hypothetical protein
MRKVTYAGADQYFIPEAEFRELLGIGDGPALNRVRYEFAHEMIIVEMDTEPPSNAWNILYKGKEKKNDA